nr:olfactory receptor 86 [Gregopimpla kuwanae]
MEDFRKAAKPNELAVLQRYVDRCKSVHITITLINYLTPVLVLCGTLIKPDEILPAPAAYPFSVDSGLMLYLAYIHQCFAAFQCSAGATIDCQTAMLMWYVGARLEILAAELEKTRNPKTLHNLIERHQQLLGLAYEAKSTMSYIALTTTTTSGIATVCSCLQLVSNEPMVVKMQFGPVALISIACLFVCAWPADNIIAVCDSVGVAAYNSPWVGMPPKLRRHILMILRRSQRPVVASIGGFIPALSLRYYASFLSAAFSYFTTLSATMAADNQP